MRSWLTLAGISALASCSQSGEEEPKPIPIPDCALGYYDLPDVTDPHCIESREICNGHGEYDPATDACQCDASYFQSIENKRSCHSPEGLCFFGTYDRETQICTCFPAYQPIGEVTECVADCSVLGCGPDAVCDQYGYCMDPCNSWCGTGYQCNPDSQRCIDPCQQTTNPCDLPGACDFSQGKVECLPVVEDSGLPDRLKFQAVISPLYERHVEYWWYVGIAYFERLLEGRYSIGFQGQRQPSGDYRSILWVLKDGRESYSDIGEFTASVDEFDRIIIGHLEFPMPTNIGTVYFKEGRLQYQLSSSGEGLVRFSGLACFDESEIGIPFDNLVEHLDIDGLACLETDLVGMPAEPVSILLGK